VYKMHELISMNKQELYDYFMQKISKVAIQDIDGEYMITGKFCRVGIDPDGQIDLWICNHRDLYKGLGQGKVNNILQAINSHVKTRFSIVNGEAWGKLQDKAVILKNLKILGIRKKTERSPEALKRQTDRLNKVRFNR